MQRTFIYVVFLFLILFSSGCFYHHNKVESALKEYLLSKKIDDPKGFEITNIHYFLVTNRVSLLQKISKRKQNIIDSVLVVKLEVLHGAYLKNGGSWNRDRFVNSLLTSDVRYLREVDATLKENFNLDLSNIYDLTGKNSSAVLGESFDDWNELKLKHEFISSQENSLDNFEVIEIEGRVDYRTRIKGSLKMIHKNFSMTPNFVVNYVY